MVIVFPWTEVSEGWFLNPKLGEIEKPNVLSFLFLVSCESTKVSWCRLSSADCPHCSWKQLRSNLGCFGRLRVQTLGQCWLGAGSDWLLSWWVDEEHKHWPRSGCARSVPELRPQTPPLGSLRSVRLPLNLLHHERHRLHHTGVCDAGLCRREASERFQHFQGKTHTHTRVPECVCSLCLFLFNFPGRCWHIDRELNTIKFLKVFIKLLMTCFWVLTPDLRGEFWKADSWDQCPRSHSSDVDSSKIGQRSGLEIIIRNFSFPSFI